MGVFKGDSYVGGNLGVAANIDVGGRVNGLVSSSEGPLFIGCPKGGGYTGSGALTGYLRVALPVLWSGNMFRFKLTVFDSVADNSFEIAFGGYLTTDWASTSAQFIASTLTKNLQIIFGNDGTNAVIYIGNSASQAWASPQARVHDLLVAYGTVVPDTWQQNWVLSIGALGTANVTKTCSLPVAKWG